jgi:hypothetical protein
MEILHL